MSRTRIALGLLFLGAFGAQFVKKDFFARLVPPYLAEYQDVVLPATRGLLLITGISFLVPPLRPVARWGSLSVLVSSLPEAVNQIRQPDRMKEAGVPPAVAPIRVLAQLGVIALVWRATRTEST